MDLLSRLERALEGVVEGVFTRAFRAQLQPIEVAKRLTREMETHRAVSVSAIYVPNLYTVHLAPATFQSYQAISGRLLAELEQYLRAFAAEHNYQTVGPLAVHLDEDADIKPGEMSISVASEAAATPTAVPTPSVLRSYPTPGMARPAPSSTPEYLEHTTLLVTAIPTTLKVIAGENIGRSYPLSDGLSIGRSPSCAIVLIEPGVSRQHAEIVWQDESWVVRDQGSTNGTFINNRRVTTHTLHIGDIIRIGTSEFMVE